MPSNRLQSVAFALLIVLALLAAALLLAACGSSSSPSGEAASATDSALKFSKCMREHGVKNFPDPEATAGGGTRLQFKAEGINQKTMETAQKACQHFQEEGGAQEKEVSPEEQVEREEAVQKFAKCMREHGIEVETSTAGGGLQIKVHPAGGGAPNPESPAFQEAQKACQSLIPGPTAGGSLHAGKAPPRGGAAEGLSMESGRAGE